MTLTSPDVGRSAMWTRRIVVVLPDPEWPVRKANSPLWTWRETSRSAYPRFGYSLETFVSLITGPGG